MRRTPHFRHLAVNNSTSTPPLPTSAASFKSAAESARRTTSTSDLIISATASSSDPKNKKITKTERMKEFPNLFRPISLGARRPVVHLPCRAIMNPMYMGVEDQYTQKLEDFWRILAEFYSMRVRGGCPMVITGGVSPSYLGKWHKNAMSLTRKEVVSKYRIITDAVHEEGGRILLQIMHGGRFTCNPLMLAASGGSAAADPHRPYKYTNPIAMPRFMVRYVITEFMRCAELARDAGFDGVELPCCYGTLLHNFMCPLTNNRNDEFGKMSQESRARMLLQTVDAVRQAVPDEEFLLSVRLSVHDLLPEGQGSNFSDVHYVAQQLQESGLVDLLCCVVGMNDSPVQTTSSYVPKGTFHPVIKQLRDALEENSQKAIAKFGAEEGGYNMPIVACTGRYPLAENVEETLQQEVCDIVGLGRPLLADSNFLINAQDGKPEETLPCIGCNRCLDQVLRGIRVGCSVNPIAGYELEHLPLRPIMHRKTVAVVGGGPTGITCALTLARRGHVVHLYEQHKEIGGQLNLAKVIPGKEDYFYLLEYWTDQLKKMPNLYIRMESKFTASEVTAGDQHFDAVVIAVGSQPRPISQHIGGINIEHKSVVPFSDVLARRVRVGRRVCIVGNGATSFDVASYLLHDPRTTRDVNLWTENWGIDPLNRKGIDMKKFGTPARINNRDVTLFQNANTDPGLMRCKAWMQRKWLKNHGISIFDHALMGKVDDDGVHFSTPLPEQQAYTLPVDTVVYCLGMLPNFGLASELNDWHFQGPYKYGMNSKDFAVYAAGSCRDVENMEGAGEQDLFKCLREGFEVGNKV